jgi:hypothetical protein
MRYIRLFCATVTLVFAFAFSAYAGNIECGGVVNPPPPPETTGQANAPLTQLAVSLITSVLSLS